MATRCKFTCQTVEDFGTSKRVKLAVVYEAPLGDNEENKRFTKATPSGECWLQIDNPAASIQFHPGVDYYATFEQCEKPTDARDQWRAEAWDRAERRRSACWDGAE